MSSARKNAIKRNVCVSLTTNREKPCAGNVGKLHAKLKCRALGNRSVFRGGIDKALIPQPAFERERHYILARERSDASCFSLEASSRKRAQKRWRHAVGLLHERLGFRWRGRCRRRRANNLGALFFSDARQRDQRRSCRRTLHRSNRSRRHHRNTRERRGRSYDRHRRWRRRKRLLSRLRRTRTDQIKRLRRQRRDGHRRHHRPARSWRRGWIGHDKTPH